MIMDDETYGHALIKELAGLTQELEEVKAERDQARQLLQVIKREQETLQQQLVQRQRRQEQLNELENLKKTVEARKREKAHLLRELASSKREYCRLQKLAGLELTFQNGHISPSMVVTVPVFTMANALYLDYFIVPAHGKLT